MKIKIELESDNYEEIEKITKALQIIVDEKTINTIQKPKEKSKESEKGKENNKVKFPKIHGKTTETIIEIVKYLESATLQEICNETDISKSTIMKTLPILRQQGILDSSIITPKRWFIKGNDPELNDMLKYVKRRKK